MPCLSLLFFSFLCVLCFLLFNALKWAICRYPHMEDAKIWNYVFALFQCFKMRVVKTCMEDSQNLDWCFVFFQCLQMNLSRSARGRNLRAKIFSISQTIHTPRPLVDLWSLTAGWYLKPRGSPPPRRPRLPRGWRPEPGPPPSKAPATPWSPSRGSGPSSRKPGSGPTPLPGSAAPHPEISQTNQ